MITNTMSSKGGSVKFATLTMEALPSMLVCIEIDNLTKTFQDAIDTTRRLGYQYIWIDSLCIIQDSTKDWQLESQTMAQVYANSSLNIAAASAKDGRYGCYIDRQRRPPLASRVLAQVDSVSGKKMFVDCMLSNDLTIFNEYPLNRRGWVVQEIHLAPRTLFFGDR